jgi:hypothetical protein
VHLLKLLVTATAPAMPAHPAIIANTATPADPVACARCREKHRTELLPHPPRGVRLPHSEELNAAGTQTVRDIAGNTIE